NSHLHISWTALDGGEGGPAFMFGLEPEYLTIGCGTFAFPPALLDTYRKRIAAEQGDDLGRILDALKNKGFRLQDPALKRVPAGFPADHPYVELSLHKGIVAWRDFADPHEVTRPDIIRRCLDHFGEMLPLWRFLRAL
ncbi:MAG: DUF2461 family protein, partial [Oricola sp.]